MSVIIVLFVLTIAMVVFMISTVKDTSLCMANNCSKPFAVVFDVPAISGNIPRLCAEHADHFVNTITLINEPK